MKNKIKKITHYIRKHAVTTRIVIDISLLLLFIAFLYGVASSHKIIQIGGSQKSIQASLAETILSPTPTTIPTPTIIDTPTPTLIPVTPTPTLPPVTPSPTTPPINNAPPAGGLQFQTVQSEVGTFNVDIIAADLNSTRVVIDTASDGDCANNCPTLPVATYAARSGAYAAINGTFFCPTEYPQCAGKTNSFDTLLMNKNKFYFNSANNVYSTVPLVYFSGNTMGFRAQSSGWGRDTSVDSVIAMQPAYVINGQYAYPGSSDPKLESKGVRNFIAGKGNMVYIGSILNATSSDAAHVLKALGVDNAINLDEGGSTALWYNGSYILGPGRNVPNAVLFLRK